MELTPWFSGYQRPVRVGVYQRNYNHDREVDAESLNYCLWNGKRWMAPWSSVDAAAREDDESGFQRLPWRGLTSEA